MPPIYLSNKAGNTVKVIYIEPYAMKLSPASTIHTDTTAGGKYLNYKTD